MEESREEAAGRNDECWIWALVSCWLTIIVSRSDSHNYIQLTCDNEWTCAAILPSSLSFVIIIFITLTTQLLLELNSQVWCKLGRIWHWRTSLIGVGILSCDEAGQRITEDTFIRCYQAVMSSRQFFKIAHNSPVQVLEVILKRNSPLTLLARATAIR